MNLTMWECKKILKRRSCKIALCLAIIYALFMGCWNGFKNLAYEDSYGKVEYSGIEEIKNQYKWVEQWRGELTSEKLSNAQKQYNKAYLSENIKVFEDGSTGPTEKSWNEYIRPLGSIPNLIRGTFQWIPEFNSYYSLKLIPLDMIENYYEERNIIVHDYLELQVSDNSDREFFIKQNEQIKIPFIYDWIEGHNIYLEFLGTVAIFITLFLCIALAPVFSDEYHHNSIGILLCSKFGRKKVAIAKVKAAMIITILTYTISMGIYLICQFAFLGTRGLDSPIQLIKPIATAPLNILQVEVFAFILGLLSCVAVSIFTLLLSSRMSTSFSVIAISLLIIFLPTIVKGNLPNSLRNILDLFPFVSDYSELFRTNIYHLLGLRIWSPYLLLIIPTIIILLFIPVTIYCYNNKQA